MHVGHLPDDKSAHLDFLLFGLVDDIAFEDRPGTVYFILGQSSLGAKRWQYYIC